SWVEFGILCRLTVAGCRHVVRDLPGVGVMFVALIVPGGCYHSLVFPWHWYLMERDRRVSGTRTVL
uniref:Uncharacterized protein n=1 Tax=Cyclopterus lumpus TaxID=8103 RepID=A0A8C2WXU8_CYCLU